MYGHNSCWGTIMSAWAQMCLGTVMYGLNRVGTIMSGYKHVWAKTCLGTVMSYGHSQMGTIMYGHKRGGTIEKHVNMLLNPLLNA